MIALRTPRRTFVGILTAGTRVVPWLAAIATLALMALACSGSVGEGVHADRIASLVEEARDAARRNDVDAAERSLARAIELDQSSHEAHLALGFLQRSRDVYHEALRECSIAARLDPMSAEAHACAGAMAFVLGRLPEAEEALRRAIVADPKHLEARVTLGRLLLRDARAEESLESLQESIRVIGDDPYLRYYEGDSLVSLGRPQEAVTALDHCVALTPDGPLPWLKLGEAFRMLGDTDKAEAALARYRELARLHGHASGGLRDIVPRGGRVAVEAMSTEGDERLR